MCWVFEAATFVLCAASGFVGLVKVCLGSVSTDVVLVGVSVLNALVSVTVVADAVVDTVVVKEVPGFGTEVIMTIGEVLLIKCTS